jgi:hypothetical protein
VKKKAFMMSLSTTIDIDGINIDVAGLEPYNNYKITTNDGCFIFNIDDQGNLIYLERMNADCNNISRIGNTKPNSMHLFAKYVEEINQ